MDCKNLTKSLVELWIGNSKETEKLSKECMDSLKDEIHELREKIKQIKREVESNYLLPELLRDNGITSQDLLKLALYELSRRMYIFSGANISKERSNLKYMWVDLGFKKIIKAFCEDCYGYLSVQLDNGFIIMVDGVIYAEFFKTDENNAVDLILDTIKSRRGK
ncbi:hypothetical protein [Stygiolobus caldivivus]|uniref:hypothetical protein n=1 Tax=Stygiolobus caldivivus TaxID=2824673 RepID=UPI001C8647E7|nr:hypothetical protein [Stygiolobus caldivivus]